MSKDNNSFLNQFESKSYSENKGKAAGMGAPVEEKKTIQRAAPARPGSTPNATGSGNSSARIKGPSHSVVTDNTYHKRKLVKYAIIGAVAIVAAVLLFFGIRMFRSVEIMDFTGRTWNEATQFGLANGISVQQNETFNIEFDEGVIFGQSVEPGTTLQRGSVLVLDVSQGADPNEVLDLPDFEDMTTGQITTWRTQMRAVSAIQIREEYHEAIEAGQFITLEHPPAVDLANFTRRDSLTVTMSRGRQSIAMPNFVGRSREDVEEWADDNNLRVTFESRSEADADQGEVLAQNIEPRTRFNTDEEIIITISAGVAVIVPDFAQISQEDMEELEDLRIIRRDRFSATVPFGRVVSQSVPAGTELIGDEAVVTVVISLGRPFMENLEGQSESMLARHFFEEFTSRGANITYTVRHVDSYEPRGTIVGMSRFGEHIGMNDHVTIDISRGNLTPPEPPAQELLPQLPPTLPPVEQPPANGQSNNGNGNDDGDGYGGNGYDYY